MKSRRPPKIRSDKKPKFLATFMDLKVGHKYQINGVKGRLMSWKQSLMPSGRKVIFKGDKYNLEFAKISRTEIVLIRKWVGDNYMGMEKWLHRNDKK